MKHRSKVIKALCLVLPLSCMAPAISLALDDDRTIENGYLTTHVGVEHDQVNLLNSIVSLSIPTKIQTVGDAINYVLSKYGYRLHIDNEINQAQYVLLEQDLPQPHRKFDVVSLHELLSTLGGDAYTLYANPVNRTISYLLKNEYSHYVDESDIEQARSRWHSRNNKNIYTSDKTAELDVITYGPVKKGESLSGIVKKLGIKSITVEQAIVMVFRLNSHAFVNNNMNHLLVGVMLAIPLYDNEFIDSPISAKLTVNQHYDRWVNHKGEK